MQISPVQAFATTLLALILSSTLWGGQQCFIFYSQDDHLEPIQKLLGSQLPLTALKLKQGDNSLEQLEAQTQARIYDIQATPCLLLSKTTGQHHKLYGEEISEENITKAQQKLDQAPKIDEKRALLAQLFHQKALSSDRMVSEEQLALAVLSCYQALGNTALSISDKQLIGLRLLYPLLLRQYTRGYKAKGAHTPATEAKLLEAVQVLEQARDLDPLSALGRQAYTQRDELRKARIQARSYE